MLDQLRDFIYEYLSTIHMPNVHITDVIEIGIITFVLYKILLWAKNTKAWVLIKGLVFIIVFLVLAALFNMTTIMWIAERGISIALLAVVVILQPELRKALEQLGKKNIKLFNTSLLLGDNTKKEGRFSDHTLDEIVKAAFAMGRDKTGALIVMECEESLSEYENTGIEVDAVITSQLLINIFEHNTPLHDGAVIIRNNRVVSATCYLPLSDNSSLSKALGTRHRAGVGISEMTDSMTVIVSEENGKISVAYGGKLYNGLSQEGLREKLEIIQDKPVEENKKSWISRTVDFNKKNSKNSDKNSDKSDEKDSSKKDNKK